MVRSIEEIRTLMDKKHNIRNISVISHAEHGKSTLTGSLLAAAGLMSIEQVGNARLTDTRADEVARGFTIKSTGISLYLQASDDALRNFRGERSGNDYLVNLIDSPGNVDFSFEVNAALRITDGALVVVDCVEGVTLQTESLLRLALGECIRPVLAVSKMDRCFLELKMDAEDAYSSLVHVVNNINVVVATCQDKAMGDLQVYPDNCSVSFSAGLHGWAFTLSTFAEMYAPTLGVDASQLITKLWGDNFYDPTTKGWTTAVTGSPTCKRGFCQFCYEPIQQVIELAMSGDKAKLFPMLASLGVLGKLKPEDKELVGTALMKRVMQTWLPADVALLEMIVYHLPSPAKAQKYRVDTLYKGPLDDAYATAIRNCDPNGPLMIYISKLVPSGDIGRFVAFGRVFSGTVSSGANVRIMGPLYVPGDKQDVYTKALQKIVLSMGSKMEAIADVPCGNTVALVGVDQYVTKVATITNPTCIDAYPMKAMNFMAAHVVSVTVEPKKPSDLSKLVEGLKRLSKSDPMVKCSILETGEHIISGAGELHLEICVSDLNEFVGGVELKVSQPAVSFRETVTATSSRTVMSKSPNKHNRLYAQASPMGDSLIEAIGAGQLTARDNPRTRAKVLVENFSWDKDQASKIWCFGPDNFGPNLFVDGTQAVQNVSEIKDSCVGAMQWVSKEGVLAEENMHGVLITLLDGTLHADAIHRGGGQIIPTCRRVIYAAQLTAAPRLTEPMYLVEIQAPEGALGGIRSVMSQRRGVVIEEKKKPGAHASIHSVKAYLPIVESFGFTAALRGATGGKAFSQCVFDHWQTLDADPLQAGSLAANIVSDLRQRKGLRPNVPPLSSFEEKL